MMKQVYTLISMLISLSAFAQGTIVGFTMSPTNPVASDTLYIYADLRFTSGSCELSDQSLTISGSNVSATAHHCLGSLTFICSAVDTFKINPLPNGNYNFSLSLTSGIAPAPCTAGIGQDDDSTFNFSVGTASISSPNIANFKPYPNPIIDHINLPSIENGTSFQLISVSGKVVKSGLVAGEKISELDDLPTGVYFLKLKTTGGFIVRRIAKK